MEYLYEKKGNDFFWLDDLWEKKEIKNLDLSIYDKFLNKYSDKILEKEPLGLCNLEKIFFLYPYSLWYWYPKTNISKLIQIAKTWDEEYCKKIFELIKMKVLEFSKNYEAVIFVPYSVERKCNFLILLKDFLKENNIKIIESYKVKPWNEIKNIKSLKEKFKVASEKFDIEKNFKDYKNILIIDDMVNTWASMCAIANKIQNKNIEVDWFSIVWSLSNELISDI